MSRAAWKYPAELTKSYKNKRRQVSSQPQPPWMRSVKVGDVLTNRNGRSQRIVRAVSFYTCGALSCVTFTIRHCSWTHRCYTVLTYVDILGRGMLPSKHNVKLKSRLDRKIAKDLLDHRIQKLDCCDVQGIP